MPLLPSRLEKVRLMYDERSDKYDDSDVHVRQARDYIQWADLKEGQSVLDLACGTGLVALEAKKRVGASGHVVGVDISDGMLSVARRKAQAAGAEVTFINHDVTDLAGVDLSPANKEGWQGFDVIVCASALILLPDPLQAVKSWVPLLRPGGRLITDVQTKDANVAMNIFAAIAPKLGEEKVLWDATRYQSKSGLEELMTEAGLTVEKCWRTEPYAIHHYELGHAPKMFEESVGQSMFKTFGRPEIKERAKSLFIDQFVETAGQSELIVEETCFWVVIASRPV